MGEDGVVVERGSVFFYADGSLDPADIPEGMTGVPVCGNPAEVLSAFPERRALGRVVREVVKAYLSHGDGSGEIPARSALLRLADRLDPEHGVVAREFVELSEA